MTRLKPLSTLARLVKAWASSFEEKSHTLLAAFYATIFFQMAVDLPQIWEPSMASYRQIQWPIAWLKSFGFSLPLEMIYFATTAGLFLATLFPFVSWVRMLAGGVLFLSSAYLASVDNHGHAKTIYVLTALVFAWPWLLSRRDTLFKWIAILQVYVISTYVSAGLWKLRFFLAEGFESGRWSELAIHHWQENVALVIAEGGFSKTLVLHSWIFSLDWLSFCLFAAVVIFQIGVVVLVFFPRFLTFGLIPVLLLHFGAMLTVGVSFRPHVTFCILLFLGSSLAAPERRAFLTRRLAVILMGIFLLVAQVVLPRVSADGEIYPFFSWNLFGSVSKETHYDLILEFSEPPGKTCFFSSCGILPENSVREPIWSLIQEAGRAATIEERNEHLVKLHELLASKISVKRLQLIRLKGNLSETFLKTPKDTEFFEAL